MVGFLRGLLLVLMLLARLPVSYTHLLGAAIFLARHSASS